MNNHRTFTPEEVQKFFHDFEAIDDLLREIQRALYPSYRGVDHFENRFDGVKVYGEDGYAFSVPYMALSDPTRYIDETLAQRAEVAQRAKEKREAERRAEKEAYEKYLRLKKKYDSPSGG